MKLIKNHYNFTSFEPFIIIAFWALLFASPLLFGRFQEEIDWEHIFKVWINYLPLLAVFLVNRFFLLPKLFFNGKRTTYFIATVTLIIFTTFAYYSFEKTTIPNRNNTSERIENIEFKNTPPRFPENRPPPPSDRQKRSQPIPGFANFLILAVLLVGFDAGLQISMRWANLEQEKFKLQKESIENQLAFLKNQISPHFFMNTLNNIHALVDIDAEELKLPEQSLSELLAKDKSNKERVEEIENTFDAYAIKYQDILKDTRKNIQAKADFDLALNHTEKEAEEEVIVFPMLAKDFKEREHKIDWNKDIIFVQENILKSYSNFLLRRVKDVMYLCFYAFQKCTG